MPTAIETKQATAVMRDTRATSRVKKSKDDEQSTLTPIGDRDDGRDGREVRRSPKMTSRALSRQLVIETMDATDAR